MKKLKVLLALLGLTSVVVGQSWQKVGAGLNGPVVSTYADTINHRLYAVGYFTGEVGYWDGSNWNIINGFPGVNAPESVIYADSNLFVGTDSIFYFSFITKAWKKVSRLGYPKNDANYPDGVCAMMLSHDSVFFAVNQNSYSGTYFYEVSAANPSNLIGPGSVLSCSIFSLEKYNGRYYAAGATSVGGNSGVLYQFEIYPSAYLSSNLNTIGLGGIYSIKDFQSELYMYTSDYGTYGGLNYYNGTSITTLTAAKSTWGLYGATSSSAMEVFGSELIGMTSTGLGSLVYKYNGTVADTLRRVGASSSSEVNIASFQNGLYLSGGFVTPFPNIVSWDSTVITGIQNVSSSKFAIVYPNPSISAFNIEGNGVASLYDIAGQLISTFKVIGRASFNVPYPGVYIVKLNSDTFRIISQ